MNPKVIDNFENMLRAGRDSALLRFSLGNEYLKIGDTSTAVSHLKQAIVFDPKFSAAWKLLGRALALCGQNDAALEAFTSGISAAEEKGDKQAAKEMRVFAKRLSKRSGAA